MYALANEFPLKLILNTSRLYLIEFYLHHCDIQRTLKKIAFYSLSKQCYITSNFITETKVAKKNFRVFTKKMSVDKVIFTSVVHN